MLTDRDWRVKYTPTLADMIGEFYVPALKDAKRYDRLTGYFSASALKLASRGIEGLVQNDGQMRLIVGCTLKKSELEAIARGETLREQVQRHLQELPLTPLNSSEVDALQLLAWMVASGHLEVKVAVPCDTEGNPIENHALFHEKAGVIEDCAGNKIAWTGSLNETAAGWRDNWESIQVFTSWGPEPARVQAEEESFASLWKDTTPRARVLDVPDAVREDLLKYSPADGLPARLAPITSAAGPTDRARLVWSFIHRAASLPGRGASVGQETSAISPWPHQVRAFDRLYGAWPPRLLIADEVGLGKTIQAGLLLRQAWLSRKAKRILILAPKAVLKQWQIELREKFNLNWPIYDGGVLRWYESLALRGSHQRTVASTRWHEESVVIASSQLMRRRERAKELAENAQPWDLIILDEAHHARRSAAGSEKEGSANALLKLMRSLKARTKGLVLLTATPMQMDPIEVWDLMNLMGLPPEWDERAFRDFCDNVNQANPPEAAMDRMARLFQAAEVTYGMAKSEDVERLTGKSRLKTRRMLKALRSRSSISHRQLVGADRSAALAVLRSYSPIRRLISRHTRVLLRHYKAEGVLTAAIADRDVDDSFVQMSSAELDLYEAVDKYISKVYSQAASAERSAVGFVMTVYRRRFASSFAALRATLERRLEASLNGPEESSSTVGIDEEDTSDDELQDEASDVDAVSALASEALPFEERSGIEDLLRMIEQLPPDSKLACLTETLDDLLGKGYRQVMVFTQFTDTMDFLRAALRGRQNLRIMCFSGRGGEIPSDQGPDGWRRIDREQVKLRFKDREADLLLCTDAAAEGLNFQFCGAIVNYDMPWNPMRVEQRIGRIDRVGQEYAKVRVVNLHYKDTIETDVYKALRARIGLFQNVVGRLQPILARMPGALAAAVLAGKDSTDAREVASRFESQVDQENQDGFDLDSGLDTTFDVPDRMPSPITMDDLDRVIRDPGLMLGDTKVEPLGHREYSLRAPGMEVPIRVTTDPEFYEEHSESVELWSPGNPFFNGPDPSPHDDLPEGVTLKDLLER